MSTTGTSPAPPLPRNGEGPRIKQTSTRHGGESPAAAATTTSVRHHNRYAEKAADWRASTWQTARPNPARPSEHVLRLLRLPMQHKSRIGYARRWRGVRSCHSSSHSEDLLHGDMGRHLPERLVGLLGMQHRVVEDLSAGGRAILLCSAPAAKSDGRTGGRQDPRNGHQQLRWHMLWRTLPAVLEGPNGRSAHPMCGSQASLSPRRCHHRKMVEAPSRFPRGEMQEHLPSSDWNCCFLVVVPHGCRDSKLTKAAVNVQPCAPLCDRRETHASPWLRHKVLLHGLGVFSLRFGRGAASCGIRCLSCFARTWR